MIESIPSFNVGTSYLDLNILYAISGIIGVSYLLCL